jgi:hypothetical protein
VFIEFNPQTMPQNRKQRRAAAAAAAEDENTFAASSIPLSRPPEFSNKTKSSSTRQAKTLLEIAAERQQELNQHIGNSNTNDGKNKTTQLPNGQFIDLNATETQFLELSSTGQISNLDPNNLPSKKSSNATTEDEEDDAELPPLIDTLFTSIPLTTVHFTLAFLAAHQYVQEIIWKDLVKESLFIAFPMLTFIIHLAHGHIISFSRRKRKSKAAKPKELPSTATAIIFDALIGDLFTARTLLFFLPLAIVLGGSLVHTTNQAGYYAAMKRAPSIGTMWVWCVLEISSPLAALVALLVPLGWGVGVMGYKIY